jgi:N6-adenosine-specific RNA methylase IME4
MDLADIKALPVQSIADHTGCHLYLWTTGTFIREAHEVAAGWGFDVRDPLTWIKSRLGLGYHWRRTTEFFLFGTMGKMRTKRRDCPTHYSWSVGEHSEKPEEFFKLVESQSPGPYVELFARRSRPGWVCWGKLTKGSRESSTDRPSSAMLLQPKE